MGDNGALASERKGRRTAQPDVAILPRGGAYRYIRRAIQSGKLTPGERLREIELAQQIGLSRTPIREALSRLG